MKAAGGLVDRALFAPMVAELHGERVALVIWNQGLAARAGARATEQIFHHYGLDYRLYDDRDYAADRLLGRCDVIVIASGASLGREPEREAPRLAALQSAGLPITLLPPADVREPCDSSVFDRVYVSRREHRNHLPGAGLTPDPLLTLSLDAPDITPRFARGVFLAEDTLMAPAQKALSLGDPSELFESMESCAALSCEFEQVVTDSGPMAVIALLCRRKVAMVPDRGGSTEPLHGSLAEAPGCALLRNLEGLDCDKPAIEKALLERLVGPRSMMLPMHSRPRCNEGWRLEEQPGGYLLQDPAGRSVRQVDAVSAMIWGLCNGELSTAEMMTDLAEAYERDLVETGRDVQAVLREYFHLGAVELDLDEPGTPASGMNPVQVEVPRIVRTGNGRWPMRITVHEPYVSHGKLHRHATLSHPDEDDWDLWFRLDQRYADAVTSRADPFLLAAVHHAMDRKASTLWIEGAPVTRTLLASVDEFQRAWACWRADMGIVPLVADEETDSPAAERPAVMCFSGGIDSCYSVYRHLLHAEPLRGPRVTAALMVHGFDIPLLDGAGFQTALARSRRILEDLRLEILTMETNVRNINLNWDRSHVLGCAAALTLLGGRFGAGLIAGTFPYNQLRAGGSNPTTDWLLGSRYFQIRNDQAASTRLQKVLGLVHWPHALRHTRFCWKDDLYGNCGNCSKCIITAMMLRCAGVETLECFEKPVSDASIEQRLRTLSMFGALERFDLQEICRYAKEHNQDFCWIPILQERYVQAGEETQGAPASP